MKLLTRADRRQLILTSYPNIETYIARFSFLTQQEIGTLRMLDENPNVHKASYFDKLQQIQDNLVSIENAKDIMTELKAASEFVDVANLRTLRFDENPDFYLRILSNVVAVEVKNFRYRAEDSLDETHLRKASQDGKLATYGNSADVQAQIEEAIAKKVQHYKGPEALFLYFCSHSPHHVEDGEIKCAARNIFYDSQYSNLIGLFYRFSNCTFLVYPARNHSNEVDLFGSFLSIAI